MHSIKYILILLLGITCLFPGSDSHANEQVDGEYIMHHIQDDRVFEIFNPLDHNDSNYGVVTKSECEEVYKKYKKKYSDKKIKWKNGKEYKYSLKAKNEELPMPTYKKVVWHCKDENKYDPETATKEEKSNYKRCDSDPNMTAACGDGYYFTEKVKLDAEWNKFSEVPVLGGLVNWKWDPSKSLSPSENPNQLMISKQLIMMFIAASIIILLFLFGYNKNKKVQSGLGNLLEVFVVFIRDEVVYPNMGHKQGRKFLPLILTFFFFIVMLNLLGLIPGSATATASFSFTVGMALITFFTYIIFGNKDFWKHIFATPGVPLWLLPIMIPVELIGLLTKPFALSVRLLANMNAGHIIIAAFLGIIINMKMVGVAIGSVPMALAINMLEIFVAFLQGYIFSLLSSIFIGMAVMEHEHH